ncbi:hypothetical protein HMPREF0239_01019 [Clostridium sp. ATCC BAA-442]|nr:hypothetical protein HMPREF0239_01019 [Clostridium sp. ATCC BAA-442]
MDCQSKSGNLYEGKRGFSTGGGKAVYNSPDRRHVSCGQPV